ncbi:retropepsin-like aspartic protease [Flavobacterium wongokense]|uniref:retropepsin-like aspartic protease n=1 Tax=Flavobacterium wongokense TaxID=2910674 RepID=UPI001F4241E1|nr:retropepsin-like aspartic protease [Flavobacterium sp. WG47]MCF6132780.1 retroviral-like aspartic protease family protein [Flavobacterium sp. WG47]
MRKAIAYLLLLFPGMLISQTIDFSRGKARDKDYFTEVKFEYINGKIIIPVTIQNKEYKFLLDTGATNCITKELKASLNPQLLQRVQVTDANNNASFMDIVSVDELSIGNVVFQNTIALASSEARNLIFDCFKIDGFIGSNLLMHSIVQIDIPNRILRITDQGDKLKLSKKNSVKMGVMDEQGSPYITISLNEKGTTTDKVLLDTGMNGFYDISGRNYQLLKSEASFIISGRSTGSKDIGLFGNSKSNEQVRIKIPSVTISTSRFLNVTTVTTNDNNSKVGSEFFEKGVVTLDFIKQKFYFDGAESIDLDKTQRSFIPTIINDKICVGIVWDDQLKDKIFTGDQIIEVNGINFENYDICQLVTNPSILKDIELKEIVVKSKDGLLKKVNL